MTRTESATPACQIGFLGAGNMATALARGFLAAGLHSPAEILASDPSPERRDAFRAATAAPVTSDNVQVVRDCRLVILAVKPQVADSVLAEIGPLLKRPQLLVSIAAGVSSARIESYLGSAPVPVVRVMPNTPALVRMGISAISPGRHASADHLAQVRRLLEAVGQVVEVPESLMDAVTAVSGSGPAYVFYFIESLAAAAQAEGLSPDVAWTLARWTVRGAAELASQSDEPVEQLRRRVTSPGGTTEAALRVLAEAGFKETLLRAVQAASKRSRELGK